MTNSLTLLLIELKEQSKQIGTKKVVNKIRGIEIPSTPK
jgi:hypothetical protein